jgi:hypothetical protein
MPCNSPRIPPNRPSRPHRLRPNNSQVRPVTADRGVSAPAFSETARVAAMMPSMGNWGRSRRALVAVGILVVVGTAAWVVRFILDAKHDDPTQMNRATVVAGVVAVVVLVPLAVGWLRRWLARPTPAAESTPGQAGAAADRLAVETAAVWSQENTRRHRLDPDAPVRVRWHRAENPEIAVPAADAVGLLPKTRILDKGTVDELYQDVYRHLGHGRLVITGAGGAGKTTAMLLLMLTALEHRQACSDDARRAAIAVPVWASLDTWDPERLGVREWIGTATAAVHPWTRSETARFGADPIKMLFDQGRIALFLDGLDEMPELHRARALERLRTEAGSVALVLSTRPDEYRDTLGGEPGLNGPVVLDLLPVIADDAAAWLTRGQSLARHRAWGPVTTALRTGKAGPTPQDQITVQVLAQVLASPLMLSLARAGYATADPSELLDRARSGEQSLRDHLLAHVLTTAYPNPTERTHADFWLCWIAHHMTARGTRDLAWWNIPTWINGPTVVADPVALAASPTSKRATKVFGGWLLAMAIGCLLVALLVAHLVGGGIMAAGIVFIVTAQVAMILMGGLTRWAMTAKDDWAAVEAGKRMTAAWLERKIGSAAATPVSLYKASRAQMPAALLWNGFLGSSRGAWELTQTQWMLRSKGRSRVRFMDLLPTAHDRQVLRVSGVHYQFRHGDLQTYLAARYTTIHAKKP